MRIRGWNIQFVRWAIVIERPAADLKFIFDRKYYTREEVEALRNIGQGKQQ